MNFSSLIACQKFFKHWLLYGWYVLKCGLIYWIPGCFVKYVTVWSTYWPVCIMFCNDSKSLTAKGCWKKNMCNFVLNTVLTDIQALSGFIAIREMSGRNKISQGQGILPTVRKILTLGKIDEKRHGISQNVRENDHFRRRDSPVSSSLHIHRSISEIET